MAKQSKKRPPLRQKSLPRINTRQRTAKKKKPGPQKEFQGDPTIRAKTDKIKRDVVNEILKLPINPGTGRPFRGAMKKAIITETLDENNNHDAYQSLFLFEVVKSVLLLN